MTRPRPHGRADVFISDHQWGIGAERPFRLVPCPDEPALSAADRGPVQHDPEVGREPKTPWVRVPVSVAEYEVRMYFQAFPGIEDRRYSRKLKRPGT